MLVRSEKLAAEGGNPHRLRYWCKIISTDGDNEGAKLTMIFETVIVDDRRKSEVVWPGSRRICVIDLSEFWRAKQPALQ